MGNLANKQKVQKVKKIKIKSNDLFHNLKSDNFLQKVFNNLETKNHLIL